MQIIMSRFLTERPNLCKTTITQTISALFGHHTVPEGNDYLKGSDEKEKIQKEKGKIGEILKYFNISKYHSAIICFIN